MKIKRFVSLLLVMTLCLTLFPLSPLSFSAAADETDAVTFTALEGTSGVSGESYDKLLDGKKTASNGTKWGVSDFNGAYIVFKASKIVVVTGYTFTTGNDNETATGRNPKSWVLYGSNNYGEMAGSATWAAIHTVTDDTTMQDKNYTDYSFSLSSNTAGYLYYKLEITATQGSEFMQLSELSLSYTDMSLLTALDGTERSGKDSESYGSLLDGDTSTKWCVPVADEPYIVFKAAQKVRANAYILTTANDTASHPERNPKSWVLYGSNDYDETEKSGTWTAVHIMTDNSTLGAVNFTPYTFTVNGSEDCYRYYKLVILKCAGDSDGLMQLSEFSLLYDAPSGVITYNATDADIGVPYKIMGTDRGLPNPAPVRFGYVFDGWYTADGTNGEWGTQITSTDGVSGDLTVYAKWHETVVTYDKNGGDTDASPASSVASAGLPTTAPTKVGYTFLGWYTKDGSGANWGEEFTDPSMLSVDTTVYARWRSDYRKVMTGAGLPSAQKVAIYLGRYPQSYLWSQYDKDEKGDPVGTENVDWVTSTNYGYELYYSIEPIKWRVLSRNEDIPDLMLCISDVCLELMYYSQTTDVSYSRSALRSYLNGYSASENADGTDFSAEADNFKDSAFTENEQKVFYRSKYGYYREYNAYNDYLYILNKNELEDPNNGMATEESRQTTYTLFAREGGKYNRTADLSGFTVSVTENAAKHPFVVTGTGFLGGKFQPNGDMTKCYFIRPAFTLDLSRVMLVSDPDGGKEADRLTAVAESETNEYKLTVFDSAHSSFRVSSSARTGNTVTFGYTGTNLRAANEYVSAFIERDNVVRYYGKLKNLASETSSYGEVTLTLPDDFDYNEGDRLYAIYEQINDDCELDLASFAYEVNVMDGISRVTFDENYSGSPTAEVFYLADASATKLDSLPNAPTRYGYIFEGWYTADGTDGEWGTEFTASATVTESMTVYAKWRKARVTFDKNGGDTEPSPSVLGFDEGLPTTPPTRLLCTFDGWYTKDGTNGVWGEAYTADSRAENDMTVYAKWTSVVPGVTFSVVSGTGGASNEGPEKLIDGSTSTKWCVSSFGEATIIVKASSPITLEKYVFITGNDSGDVKGRNPKSWVLYGCNDCNETDGTGTWTAIHTVTNDTVMQDVNITPFTFDIPDNTRSYRYYKLHITANGGNDCMQLSEWQLHSADCEYHTWSVSTVAPTCTEDGYTKYTCSVCGRIYKDSFVDKTGHKHTATSVVAPTCTAKGYTVYTCSACGDTYNGDETDMIDHSWEETSVIPSTCTEEGSTLYTCSVCKTATKTEPIAMAKHTWSLTSTFEPTCTKDGYKLYTCSVCETATKTEPTGQAALGHITTSNPCTRCGVYRVAEVNGVCYYEVQTAFDNANGGTVKLIRNAELTEALKVAGKLTFDLNGYTLTQTGNDRIMTVKGTGSLTLQDTSTAGIGTITGGKADSGAGIYVESGGGLTVTGGTITNCAGKNGGGIYACDNALFSMTGGTITNCTATNQGGAIHLRDFSETMTLTGVTLSGNTAGSSGGAICSYRSLNIENSVIKENNAILGGGIYEVSSGTTLTLGSGAVVENNRAEGGSYGSSNQGGGIYTSYASVILESGSIVRNNSAYYGGGVAGYRYGSVTVNDGALIQNNSATTEGGAVSVWISSTLTVNGGEISGNTAGIYGGAIYGFSGVTINIQGGTIKKNSAKRGGGLYAYYSASTIFISGGAIEENTATLHGGGIYVSYGAVAEMSGGTIKNNTAKGAGGGVYYEVSKNSFTLSGGSITGNSAVGDGGGVHLSDASYMNMTGGEISNNTSRCGSGIYIYGSSTLTATGGAIKNNTATDDGGAIYRHSKAGAVSLTGVTVSGNTAGQTSGGLSFHGSATVSLTDTSITGNFAATGAGVYVNSSALTVNGGVRVTGNKIKTSAGTTDEESNLYLTSGNTVTAGSTESKQTTLVGVTLESGDGDVTTACETDVSAYVVSDRSRFTVSYADSVVKLVRVASSLSLSTDSLTVENAPTDSTVYAAVYGGGRLLDVYSGKATNGTTAISELGLKLSGVDTLTAFLLDRHLSPLCEAATVEIK